MLSNFHRSDSRSDSQSQAQLSDTQLISKAKYYLTQGDLIAFDTDTVPGIAALWGVGKARQKIFSLKKRPSTKPLVWMLDNINRVKEYFLLEARAEEILQQYWPGAITFVLKPKKNVVPDETSVGVRIPNDDFIRELIKELNTPLYVTSANLSGEKDILTLEEIKKTFGKEISLYIDQRKNQRKNLQTAFTGRPSTVVDLRDFPYEVLRQGVVEFG